MAIRTESAGTAAGATSQDRSAVLSLDGATVLVIADGAGGLGGGERAAEFAVGEICRWALGLGDDRREPRRWAQLLQAVDEALLRSGLGGETTAVAVAVFADCMVGAAVGDSAAWWVSATGHRDLICQKEPKVRLGSGEAWPTAFSAGPEEGEGTLLLMTDGLWRYASPKALCERARHVDLARAARDLVDLVRLPTGAVQDDVTVLLGRR